MALSTSDRIAIHAGLVTIMDDAHADAFLAAHPAHDRDDLVTKGDLRAEMAELRAEQAERFAKVDVEFERLRADQAEKFATVDTRFAELRTELAGSIRTMTITVSGVVVIVSSIVGIVDRLVT